MKTDWNGQSTWHKSQAVKRLETHCIISPGCLKVTQSFPPTHHLQKEWFEWRVSRMQSEDADMDKWRWQQVTIKGMVHTNGHLSYWRPADLLAKWTRGGVGAGLIGWSTKNDCIRHERKIEANREEDVGGKSTTRVVHPLQGERHSQGISRISSICF